MRKELISIRLESEVLDWFRTRASSGYQTLINAALREYVDRAKALAERRAGRAQQLFKQFYARCFWHYDPNLEIAPDNMSLVVEGLRKYGGREGLCLAEELCQ